ncbi:MAG: lipid II:glycine glycyltransferase FemX [Chloroflexota bacterium]
MRPPEPTLDESAQWDQFVERAEDGHSLQSWGWGVLKAQYGWKALRVVVPSSGDIAAAAQVLVRELPLGLGKIGYVPRGPVVDFEDTEVLERLVAELKSLIDEEKLISLKIEPEVLESGGADRIRAHLARLGFIESAPVQRLSSIWVDLTAPEEDILARMKQKTRYNIRLAEKKGVRVITGSEADISRWYELYKTTARRDGFTIHQREYYRRVLATMGKHNHARLLIADHEGEMIAAIMVFQFGRGAQYMYGASAGHKRNLMAPYLLQYEAIRWAKLNGAQYYDLWGIPDRLVESDPLWGVYRHKRGYGGQEVRYIGAFDLVRSPVQHALYARMAEPAYKWISTKRVDATRAERELRRRIR